MPSTLDRGLVFSILALGFGIASMTAWGCSGGATHEGTTGGGPHGGLTNDAGDGGDPGRPGGMYDGGSVPPEAGLPSLPELTHVSALVRGNSARISFDPYPGAVDYRVYVLPAAADVNKNADGSFASINNALYRCAGYRSAPGVTVDGNNGPKAPASPIDQTRYPVVNVFTQTIVDVPMCDAANDDCNTNFMPTVASTYTRSLPEATLAYAFADRVAGTVPVYAVGDPHPWADAYGNGVRTPETRSKKYVLDRTSYLKEGWRDDGVAFYAPDAATSAACGGPLRLSPRALSRSRSVRPSITWAPNTAWATRGAPS